MEQRELDGLDMRIRKDFEEWSGGFPPESFDQVEVYIDAARPSDTDEQAVRELLRAWLAEQ